MDLATIIGLIGVFGLLIGGILAAGSNLAWYVDIPSVIAVIGGGSLAVMLSGPLGRFLKIPTYFSIAFRVPANEKEKVIRQLITFSEDARKEGLLSLDDKLDDVEDDFLKSGMRLVVDGADPEVIRNIMNTELSNTQNRHTTGADVLGLFATLLPAFGMIGTVQGLVAMMQDLTDAAAIGKGMALALITTFYGAILANGVFTPLKSKLLDRDKEETLLREIIIEGVLSIHNGENPRMLEQKLLSFLPPNERRNLMTEEAG